MDNEQDKSLEQRVQRLENAVADLRVMVRALLTERKQVEQEITQPAPTTLEPERSAPPPPPAAVQPEQPTVKPHPEPIFRPQPPPPPPSLAAKMQSAGFSLELPAHMRNLEFWLNKVGIGLLLFAVVFLFKYSIDKGWLTPWVRVYFGLALGVVLIGLGYRTYDKRRHFSLVFLGGGIATLYITAFAAFQRLAIVSHTESFAFMVLVTVLALALSLKQNDPVLSILGAIGGFGTPFMLYTGSGNIPGLITYTCVLIAATMAIFYFKGWRSLLWITVASGWTIVLIALGSGILSPDHVKIADQRAVQAGALFAFLCFWTIPVLRQLLRPSLESDRAAPAGTLAGFVARQAHWLSVSSPLIGLAISHAIWPDLSKTAWGITAMTGAALYFLVSYGIHKAGKEKDLAYTHMLMGGLLFTIALCFLFDGDTLFFAIAAEATVLHLVALRTQDKGIAIGAHLLFGILTAALAVRFSAGPYGPIPMINSMALADLFAIAAAIGLSYRFKDELAKDVYFLIGYLLLAGWFCRELEGNILFTVLTAQMVAFHLLTFESGSEFRRHTAQMFSVGVGIWLVQRIVHYDTYGTALINPRALADAWAIVAALGLSYVFKDERLRRSYFLAGYFVLAGWFCRELEGNLLFFILTAQAALFHWLTYEGTDTIRRIGANVFSSLLAIWLIDRMIDRETSGTAILNSYALVNFLAIAIAAGAAWISKIDWERLTYAIGAHVLFMGWLLCELSTLNEGQGYVTIAWGVYGALLLVIGLRRNAHRLRIVAVVTLFAVVAKLFLIDLANIEAIFRILLFMGFGAVFLALSYYFRSLWKPDSKK